MVGPQFPGQSPGPHGPQQLLQQQQQDMMRRQRERQMQGAWDASQRKMDDSMQGRRAGQGMQGYGPYDRLGFFGRLFRGLFTLAFWMVTIGLFFWAAVSFMGGYTTDGFVTAGLTLVAFFITTRIRRWGRG